jgi:hypothetical protein
LALSTSGCLPTPGYAHALACRRQFPEPERVSALLIDFFKR